MNEREAINAKDIDKVLDIDASGQKGRWLKLAGIVDRRKCNICNATLAYNNPYTKFCSNCGANMKGDSV